MLNQVLMFDYEKYDKAEKSATQKLVQGEDSEEETGAQLKVKRKSASMSAKSGAGNATYMEYKH